MCLPITSFKRVAHFYFYKKAQVTLLLRSQQEQMYLKSNSNLMGHLPEIKIPLHKSLMISIQCHDRIENNQEKIETLS